MPAFKLFLLDVMQCGNADVEILACIALHKSNLEEAADFWKAGSNQFNNTRLLDNFHTLTLEERCDCIEDLFHIFNGDIWAYILHENAQSLGYKNDCLVLSGV